MIWAEICYALFPEVEAVFKTFASGESGREFTEKQPFEKQ